MKVLVTGGAGYIGSHAVKVLLAHGHEVHVLDSLEKGHKEAVDPEATLTIGNTSDRTLVQETVKKYGIQALMHFAASIEVGESVIDPYKYYRNNFTHTLDLLDAVMEMGVKKIVFSSTAAVYGNPEKTPIDEHQARNPINPYGRSKMMSEMAIEDFCTAHGLGYAILRYFNVAGAHPDGHIGEDHHPESHLIPRILQAAHNNGEVKIFGTDYPTKDGTCIRDYVHVMDLAQAHALALEDLKEGTGDIYNIGSASGFTVREIIKACEKVTGKTLKVIEEARRAGDPDVLIAKSDKIRQNLNWEPKYSSVETIVAHAWKWHSQHPFGYAERPSKD